MKITECLSGLTAIVLPDLVPAGDNALVIALAARNLPKELQKRAAGGLGIDPDPEADRALPCHRLPRRRCDCLHRHAHDRARPSGCRVVRGARMGGYALDIPLVASVCGSGWLARQRPGSKHAGM